MVNPIIRSPDPEEEVKRANEQKRKAPPTKDFNEALEQVDQRRQQPQEDGLNKELKGAKKPLSAMKKKEDSVSPMMSPFDLAAKGAKKSDTEEEEVLFSLDDIANASSSKFNENSLALDTRPAKKSSPSFESIEQHDIDTVNPQGYVQTYVAPAQALAAIQPVDNKAPAAPVPRPIHDIMNEIVKQIDYLKLEGKTETTIELKGTFAGSKLIITQFDSDKTAMNITFDNLSAVTQPIIDAHKNTLIKNLDDINIHVHIFIASSTIESNPIATAKSDTGQSDNKERNLRDGRKQNREQEA